MNGLRIGSTCSGYEGLGMAIQSVFGGELAWVADNDPGAAKILAHHYPDVPNLGNITVTDWATVEPVDILTAGFPCQDVSCAGGRAGLREGNRTGVWAHVARAIDALRPSLVVLENVRGLLSAGADSDVEPCPWCLGEAGDEHALRAAGAVLGDLADLGYDAEWATVSAADAGAPHRRERVFIVACPAAEPAGVRLPLRQPEHLTRGGRAAVVPDGRDTAEHDGIAHQGSPHAEDADRTASGERRLTGPGEAEGGRARADAGRPGGAPAIADAEVRGRNDRVQHAVESGSAGARSQAQGNAGGGDFSSANARGEGLEIRPVESDRHECQAAERGRGDAASWPACPWLTDCGAIEEECPDEPGRWHTRAGYCTTDPHALCAEDAADADGGGRRPESRDNGRGRRGRLRPAGHEQGDFSWGNYGPAIRRWEHVTGRTAPRPTEPGRTGERLSPTFVEWLMGLPEGWVTGVPGLSRNAQLHALGNGVVPQQAAMALRMLLARTDGAVAA